jgi:hypothetical protein
MSRAESREVRVMAGSGQTQQNRQRENKLRERRTQMQEDQPLGEQLFCRN